MLQFGTKTYLFLHFSLIFEFPKIANIPLFGVLHHFSECDDWRHFSKCSATFQSVAPLSKVWRHCSKCGATYQSVEPLFKVWRDFSKCEFTFQSLSVSGLIFILKHNTIIPLVIIFRVWFILYIISFSLFNSISCTNNLQISIMWAKKWVIKKFSCIFNDI